MNSRLLDVLHDAADENRLPVARTVHVDLDGIIEESVEQDRRFLRRFHGLAHVP